MPGGNPRIVRGPDGVTRVLPSGMPTWQSHVLWEARHRFPSLGYPDVTKAEYELARRYEHRRIVRLRRTWASIRQRGGVWLLLRIRMALWIGGRYVEEADDAQ